MPTTVIVDASSFDGLADDLKGAADQVLDKVAPVVARGAVNVKATMREDMQSSRHFGQVAASISYDIERGSGWVEAEVGPVTEGRTVGDLAHFAYFGGSPGGGATVRDPQGNLDDEEPRFRNAINDVVGGLLA